MDGITDTNNFGFIIEAQSAGPMASSSKALGTRPRHGSCRRRENLWPSPGVMQVVRELKKKGIWIAGADPDGEKAYYEAGLKGSIGLVIGSEGEGISRVIREECDFLVKIPMKGNISSLNAGVAAALIMFEISRHRDAHG